MKDPRRDSSAWITEADADLEAARLLSDRLPALACFHAQQAAEKALKAMLYAAGERAVLGHSLRELGEAVQGRDPGYSVLRAQVTKLDRYYVATRYPNGLPEGGHPSEAFDQTDAAGAITTATAAIEHARRFIEERLGDQT